MININGIIFVVNLTIPCGYQATKKAATKSKKFELTEEQKQEIREAFDLFDTDGSGKIINIV